jgi:hypothetical protein
LIDNPYVGPRTFTRDKSALFFGREQEAKDLLAVVLTNRLTLFYAQSGAGKSSLLNTRLIPALAEQENFLVLPVGRVSGKLPQGIEQVDNIFVFNLLVSLDQSEVSPERLTHLTIPDFLANLVTEDGDHYFYSPDEQATETTEEEYAPVPHILIIDQFEEILTTHLERWEERETFFQQLNQAMAADPMLWVLLTLREDHVAALRPYSRLTQNNMRARFYMQRMEETAARQAIEEPAKLGGRPFAPGVAQTLVENLRQIKVQGQEQSQPGQFIEPVQLQVVCFQLWQGLAGSNKPEITQKDLEEVGDVDRALASFYEDAIANAIRQTGVSEVALRDWFERELITEAETRGTVYQGQTETAGMTNDVVAALAAQYLLRAEIRAGGTWYELVHDRFVAPILQANQAWRLQQSPLIRAAQEWARSDWRRDKLYKDDQLRAAVASVDMATAEPIVRDFLQASQDAQSQRDLAEAQKKAAAEARIARRLRLLTIGLAVAITIAVIFAVIAYRQRNIAVDEAEANARIAATSEANAFLAATKESEANENAELAATSEAAAVANANLAATSEAIAEANAEDASEARELAEENAELAARSATELEIQPLVLNYLFDEAVAQADEALQFFEVDIPPELVVASALVNVASYPEFFPQGYSPDAPQTTAALSILDRAFEIEPPLAEQLPDLATLYTKLCRQIDEESTESLLAACQNAVELANELGNASVTLQVCSLQGNKVLSELEEAITAVCDRIDQQANPIALNQSSSGVIEPGSSDSYIYTSPGNEILYIFMRYDNSSLDSFLELYGPERTLLTSDDQSGGLGNAQITYPLITAGPYIIVARGWSGETEGAYQLTLSDQPIAIYDSIAYGNLEMGETLASTIEPGEVEFWSFDGQQGQTISLNMTADNSDLDSYLFLMGPRGEYVADNDDSGFNRAGEPIPDASIILTLPATGQYLITARASDFATGQGDYTLALELVGAAAAHTQMGTLQPGQTAEAFLEPAGSHLWTFVGEAGQTISLAAFSLDGNLDGYLTLLGPDGYVLATDDDSFGERNPIIVTELPQTAVYSAIVSGFDEFTNGDYLLELGDGSANFSFGSASGQSNPPIAPLPPPVTSSSPAVVEMGRLIPNQPALGTLLPGDAHFWTFEGTAGDAVAIYMRANNSALDSALFLVGPDGVILAQTNEGLDALLEGQILPTTGSYTVIARGGDDSTFGDYILTLSLEPG